MIKIKSIRLKCLLFEVALITLLIVLFGYITLDLIISDKTNQIKENLAHKNETSTSVFENYLEQAQVLFSIAENEYYRGRLKKENASFFEQFKMLKGLTFSQGEKEEIVLGEDIISNVLFDDSKSKDLLLGDGGYRSTLSEEKNILKVTKKMSNDSSSISLYFSINAFKKVFNENLGNLTAQVLFDRQEIIFSNSEGISNSVLQKLKNEKFASGNLIIKEISILGKSYITACSMQGVGYRYCYLTDRENGQKLIYNLSFKYLIFFIAASSILGILTLLLLRRFTKPLENLTSNAIEVAKGNLDVESKAQSDDEIGKLALSFNFMTKKLKSYIEEVKDKVRMEEELNIANTVQNYFFPTKGLVQFENLEIKGLHLMASECGGDWWGAKEVDGHVILLLGDATGHGVPSALITSAVYSTVNMLPDIYDKNPEIIRPDNILEALNKTVHSLGQEILMTFFVAVITPDRKKMLYSNASHNHPFLVNEESGKSTIIQGAMGRRLGESLDSTYSTEEVALDKGDFLLVYTDGITEAINQKGRMYGEKRLLRKLKKSLSFGPSEILEVFLADVKNFCESSDFDDDVTMACLKIN